MSPDPLFTTQSGPSVALLVVISVVAILTAGCGGSDEPAQASGDIRLMGVVSEADGWVLTEDQLLLTNSSGEDWQKAADVNVSDIHAVQFIDASTGWVIGSEPSASGVVSIMSAQTVDAGKTWTVSPVNEPNVDDFLSPSGPAYVYFQDEKHGWIAWSGVSSAQFSHGFLYRTADGGATWETLSIPISAQPVFSNEHNGIVAGGAAGNELFVTSDGGVTWQAVTIPITAEFSASYPMFGTPALYPSGEAELPVTFAGTTSQLVLYTSIDSGATWRQTGKTNIAKSEGDVTAQPSDSVAPASVVSVSRDGGKAYGTKDGGGTWSMVSPNGLSAGVTDIDFATDKAGWALVQTNACLSFKDNCIQSQGVYATKDGGQTWEILALP